MAQALEIACASAQMPAQPSGRRQYMAYRGRVVKCKYCNGTGKVSDGTVSGKKVPCPACGGSGVQRV